MNTDNIQSIAEASLDAIMEERRKWRDRVVAEAGGLRSEGENPEYDRALVELTCLLLGKSCSDDGAEVARSLGIDPTYWLPPGESPTLYSYRLLVEHGCSSWIWIEAASESAARQAFIDGSWDESESSDYWIDNEQYPARIISVDEMGQA